MPRRKDAVYVCKDRDRYRVITQTGSERASRVFKTKKQAEVFAEGAREGIKQQQERTIGEALELYRQRLELRGTSEGHRKTTMYRLLGLCDEVLELRLVALTQKKAEKLYESYAKSHSVDTHRNALNQARSAWRFFRKRKMTSSNPWVEVEGIGKRSTGKEQLTRDESRRLSAECLGRPADAGAAAVLCALWTGLRASEICSLDEAATGDAVADGLLHVRQSKTASGIRSLLVPPVLAALLTRHVPFPGDRHWLARQAARLCIEAGIRAVTPHGLRGTHASLARGAGATPELVAAALGHASVGVTERHYIDDAASAAADQQRVLRVLQGGAR